MTKTVNILNFPCLPLEGSIDLTYRCNNHCRHCWLWVPDQAEVQKNELAFEEIRHIVNQARAMGCRRWSISGGEPMLRPDFPEIFEYVTERSIGYTLNTNGTLITPKTAQLLKRKGAKMIALYGATADIYDHITRHPGGFAKVMQGFAYLKEAGANFIVQLIPMQDNYHQWDEMIKLAQSLSPHWRVGASWLYFSHNGSPVTNREISAQRLTPEQVIKIDRPKPYYNEQFTELEDKAGLVYFRTGDTKTILNDKNELSVDSKDSIDDRLFAGCIEKRSRFHIDAYGRMSWCSFVKDQNLLFDLRRGSFKEGWDIFIPACSDKIRGTDEWRDNCGGCTKQNICRWCAAYAYLETGGYSTPIPYLCMVSKEAESYMNNWKKKHQRYFRIGGITVRLDSDVDFDTIAFNDALQKFAVEGSGKDHIVLRHHFELPNFKEKEMGKALYHNMLFKLFYKQGNWFYQRYFSNERKKEEMYQLAVFSTDHRHGTIFTPPHMREKVLMNGWNTLSLFPTDQFWLLPLLTDRNALLLHSAAVIIQGRAFLFVGDSESGKSTIVSLLNESLQKQKLNIEILCDENNIVRQWYDGWRAYGTWKHSTMPYVSNDDAPLGGIFFLQKAHENIISKLTDRKLIWRQLLASLIRVADTSVLWKKKLDILEDLVQETPCYTMLFDKSGKIIRELERLVK